MDLNFPEKYINVIVSILLISQHLSDESIVEESFLPLYSLIYHVHFKMNDQSTNCITLDTTQRLLTFLSLSLFVSFRSSYIKVGYRKSSVPARFMQASLFKNLSNESPEGSFHCEFLSIVMTVLASSIECCFHDFAALVNMKDRVASSYSDEVVARCLKLMRYPEIIVAAITCLQIYR
jgi:hypothetical protein